MVEWVEAAGEGGDGPVLPRYGDGVGRRRRRTREGGREGRRKGEKDGSTPIWRWSREEEEEEEGGREGGEGEGGSDFLSLCSFLGRRGRAGVMGGREGGREGEIVSCELAGYMHTCRARAREGGREGMKRGGKEESERGRQRWPFIPQRTKRKDNKQTKPRRARSYKSTSAFFFREGRCGDTRGGCTRGKTQKMRHAR